VDMFLQDITNLYLVRREDDSTPTRHGTKGASLPR
jgi:hypothetical protein